jgi:endonuclease YncB( thermonuclease family)
MKVAGLIIVISLLSFVTAGARDFNGQYIGVSDGDTITVLDEGKGEKPKLFGIDRA